jgi:hypothetical protein
VSKALPINGNPTGPGGKLDGIDKYHHNDEISKKVKPIIIRSSIKNMFGRLVFSLVV